MQHACSMSRGNTTQNGQQEPASVLRSHGLLVEMLAQRASAQQLHDQVELAFVFAAVMHRNNVRMLDARSDLCFALEARSGFCAAR
jgi:anthranilate phosphoribosyltransferase